MACRFVNVTFDSYHTYGRIFSPTRMGCGSRRNLTIISKIQSGCPGMLFRSHVLPFFFRVLPHGRVIMGNNTSGTNNIDDIPEGLGDGHPLFLVALLSPLFNKQKTCSPAPRYSLHHIVPVFEIVRDMGVGCLFFRFHNLPDTRRVDFQNTVPPW